ncbi:hypothetical protein N1851_016575 [Merluccius polli]|uniref:SCAN box domain-containing protein n=1 Tax=Merluccius polli TaxID=89951 RepID=A0AA47MRC8_MERPO|nr:hypothetical protein N1851_016575 [Merluccius polli]
MHLEHERFLKELEFKHAALSSSSSASAQFNVASNIKLVPPFAEKNVERYFAHFERVATVSDWPIHAWTSLLQSVLVGKAQDAYTALNIEDIKDYEKVKGAILRTYELVPEAYRQRFRGLSKLDEQTYVEFAREKEISFSSWCKSQKAETKEDLRQLVLLEDFKNCLPTAVCTYLNQQEVTTLDKAAVLADKFVLTLKVNFDNDQVSKRPDDLEKQYPEAFPVCVTTRAMSKKKKQDKEADSDIALFDTFLAKGECGQWFGSWDGPVICENQPTFVGVVPGDEKVGVLKEGRMARRGRSHAPHRTLLPWLIMVQLLHSHSEESSGSTTVVEVGEVGLMREVMVGVDIGVVGLEVAVVMEVLGEKMGVLVGVGGGVLVGMGGEVLVGMGGGVLLDVALATLTSPGETTTTSPFFSCWT